MKRARHLFQTIDQSRAGPIEMIIINSKDSTVHNGRAVLSGAAGVKFAAPIEPPLGK